MLMPISMWNWNTTKQKVTDGTRKYQWVLFRVFLRTFLGVPFKRWNLFPVTRTLFWRSPWWTPWRSIIFAQLLTPIFNSNSCNSGFWIQIIASCCSQSKGWFPLLVFPNLKGINYLTPPLPFQEPYTSRISSPILNLVEYSVSNSSS